MVIVAAKLADHNRAAKNRVQPGVIKARLDGGWAGWGRKRDVEMMVRDLGVMAYREAWSEQERAHAQVLAGGEEVIFLVEHPPVITFGRRGDHGGHLLAAEGRLAEMGVELVQSDRGGDITFHGPGQLVVYPVLRLADHKLSVSGYVHRLEQIVIEMLAEWGIHAQADPAAVGVWVEHAGKPEKVCAIGVRIKRGVTLHGLALNVTTDLRYFDLIVPCGLTGRGVTSLHRLLGDRAPRMDQAKQVMRERMIAAFG